MENKQKVYRFKISNNDFYDRIVDFASYHKYENNETLKESYQSWCEEDDIKNYIAEEEMILSRYNYDLNKNNIYKKIYKSIKYYHIKNMLSNKEKKEPIKERKKNVQFSKEFINCVKTYLQNNYHNKDFKPSSYYDKFCQENIDVINKEISRIIELKEQDTEYIYNKMKKMFKNQYFTIFNKVIK